MSSFPVELAKWLTKQAIQNAGGVVGTTNPAIALIKKALAYNYQRKNRLRDQPWNPAPAWAASTAYVIGQEVVNGGNVYVCNGAGTSASSGGPTTATDAFITDGTVSWEYLYSNQFTTSLPDGPSWSSSTTAPSSPNNAKFYRNALSGYSSGATTVITADTWFTVLGFTGGLGSSGIGVSGVGRGGISFMMDAATLVIARNSSAGYGMFVEVDGQYLTESFIPDLATGHASTYTTITFPSKKDRRIVLRFDTQQSVPLQGIYTDAFSNIWPAQTLSDTVAAAFMCDSYGLGGAQPRGSNEQPFWDRTVPATIAARLGFDNCYINSVSGTGFVAGSSVYGAPARVTAVAAYNPNIVFTLCSVNDTGLNAAAIQAAVVAYIQAMRAALPNALFVFIGVTGGRTGPDAGEVAAIAGITQAADSNTIFLPGSTAVPEPVNNGSGYNGSFAGLGNADWYMANNLHPTAKGALNVGKRMSLEFETAFAATSN